MTTPTTGHDPRYVSSNDRRAVLRAWAGADAAVDMGGWIDDDQEAFQAAVRRRVDHIVMVQRAGWGCLSLALKQVWLVS